MDNKRQLIFMREMWHKAFREEDFENSEIALWDIILKEYENEIK